MYVSVCTLESISVQLCPNIKAWDTLEAACGCSVRQSDWHGMRAGEIRGSISIPCYRVISFFSPSKYGSEGGVKESNRYARERESF